MSRRRFQWGCRDGRGSRARRWRRQGHRAGRCAQGLRGCRLPVPPGCRHVGGGDRGLADGRRRPARAAPADHAGARLPQIPGRRLPQPPRRAHAGVRTWGDLRITREDDPGSALEPERSYKLVVIVSDISDNRLLRLPWDYDRLGVSAGQVDETPVADAVRASASIPFFFQPCMLKVPGRGGQVYLTDGGMLSNFPIDVFDRRDDQRPRWPTFGVKLSAKPNANLMAPAPSIRGVVRFGLALVATMTNAHDQMHLDEASVVDRTVFVDTFGVKATDFDLDAKTRDQLFDKGTAAGKKFLDGWNFDRYLDTYWKPASAATASS